MLEQAIWLQLIHHSRKKAHAFPEIWTRDTDHDPERRYTLDRLAMVPYDKAVSCNIEQKPLQV